MARKLITTRVKSVKKLTSTQREIQIQMTPSEELGFKAGQYVMLQIPNPENKRLQRAYSLACTDKIQTEFTLLIKIVEDGKASTYIEGLKEGDKAIFAGPFGKLLFNHPAKSQVLMLCTGAGLSQHMSFLLSHAADYPDSTFNLLIGVWNESEVFWTKELDELKERLPSFNYDFVLFKGSDKWKGKTGFVTSFIDDFNISNETTDVYLCGNPKMIEGATDALKQRGISDDNIFAESFG